MTVHQMKLQPQPFDKIRSGQKTVELRLLDEKRKRVAVGDVIEFLCVEGSREKLRARVVALHRFDSFAALFRCRPLVEKCGYAPEELPFASARDMERYYSKEEEARWGVVAIELQLLERSVCSGGKQR